MNTNEQNVVFNYADAPKSWRNCFNDTCPKAEECMHHLTGKNIPDNLTCGDTVYPNACKDGKCRYFKQIRVMRGAYGFNAILSQFPRTSEERLRAVIKNYLGGHGTYYDYNKGRKLLTPEQQERIVNLFRNNGYTGECEFEGYRYVYDFN